MLTLIVRREGDELPCQYFCWCRSEVNSVVQDSVIHGKFYITHILTVHVSYAEFIVNLHIGGLKCSLLLLFRVIMVNSQL